MEVLTKMQFVRNSLLPKESIYEVKDFNYKDTSTICSWVKNQEMLSMISGEKGNGLDADILEKWITSAIKTIVIHDIKMDKVVGFCTISVNELPVIRHKCIELCHLIFSPEYCLSRYEIGLQLASEAEYMAFLYGFNCIIGRVVTSNNYAIKLAKKANWKKDDTISDNFIWFKKEKVI